MPVIIIKFSKMNNRLVQGFIAGATGAIILVVIMYIMKAAGLGDPGFVSMYKATFGSNPRVDQILGTLLFIISGGIWGVIYALMIKHATVLNGFLFGLLPTLWLWVAVNAFLGKPLFNGFAVKGLVLPIIFNMVIWGSYIGWYMSRRNTSAVLT
jgi:hypothetical protein